MGILIVFLGLFFLTMCAVPELLVLVCVIEYRRMYGNPVAALQPAVVCVGPAVVPTPNAYTQAGAA